MCMQSRVMAAWTAPLGAAAEVGDAAKADTPTSNANMLASHTDAPMRVDRRQTDGIDRIISPSSYGHMGPYANRYVPSTRLHPR